MPSFSVVIPTYNRSEFLEGAIEKVINQTYTDLEVLVVDDGSGTAYAAEVVSQYPNTVQCIVHDENRGLSAARNTGIANADGGYIAFLDDDDRWHKTKVARQVSALEENKEAGIATCLVAAITPENEIVHCETDAPNGDCSESLLIGNQIGTPSRVLVRRECFDDIGTFDESLPTKQDWDFYLRLCQEWNVAAVEDHLCFRTVHDSMSSSPVAVERDKKAILEKHEILIRSADVWKQAQASVLEEIGRSRLGNNDLKIAREYLLESLSEFKIKRLILLLLTYSYPVIVQKSIHLKRNFERQRSNCTNLTLTPMSIPGLNS
jgi:glycosyltransferase involved in cell wall biosynthesis